jgi:hypothetical protein
MKKIVIFPKTDTVTLCLPEQWIGIPIVCEMKPLTHRFNYNDDFEIMVNLNNKRRKRNSKNAFHHGAKSLKSPSNDLSTQYVK